MAAPQLLRDSSPATIEKPIAYRHAVPDASDRLFPVIVAAGILCGVAVTVVSLFEAWVISVAGLCGLVLFVCLCLRPVITLGVFSALWAPLMIFMMDTEIGVVGGIELNMSRLLGGVLVFALAVRAALSIVRSGGLSTFPGPYRWYLAFAGVICFSVIRSPGIGDALGDLVRFLAGLLLLFVVWLDCRTERDVRILHVLMLAGVGIASAITVLLWVAGSAQFLVLTRGAERAVGALGGANATGSLAVLGFALLAPWALSRRAMRGHLLTVAMTGAFVGAIVGTLSRTAVVGLAIFLAIWIPMQSHGVMSRGRKLVFVAALLACVVVGVAARSSEDLASRVADVPGIGESNVQIDSAGSGRVMIWRYHLWTMRNGSMEQLLLGRGFGSSMEISKTMYWQMGQSGNVEGVHNSYLWLIEEVGLLGLAVYGMFLLSLVRFLWGTTRARGGPASSPGTRGLAIAFLAYLVSYQLSKEMFGWGITEMAVRWYFLLYLAITLRSSAMSLDYLTPGGRPAAA